MSIVACVKVRDGLVLGAESMTQIWGTDAAGNTGVIKTYEHGQKLYQIGNLAVGVMTYGIGNIGPRSVSSFISEFSREVDPGLQVEKICVQLMDFLKKVHQGQLGMLPQEKQPMLGVYVAGYSSGNPLGEEWEFKLPSQEGPKRVRPADAFGASWRGVSIPFTRLYFGLDPNLRDELVKAGMQEGDIRDLRDKYKAPIVFDSMPVQDAIDFVVFILGTTINMAKFEIGPPSCGGPLWVAVISSTERFQWIEKPRLQPSQKEERS